MISSVWAGMHGALAGTLATTVMTGFFGLARWTGLYPEQFPPTKITKSALDAVGLRAETGDDAEIAVAAAAHWAFGTGAGAVFGVLQKWLHLRLPGILQGAAFGLLVWIVSYMGWVPAAGLMSHPRNQRPDQVLVLVASHVVYGASLGGVVQAIERRG